MACAGAALVAALAASALGPPASAEEDERQAYRFLVKAEGRRATAFRGLITVDGRERAIEEGRTPFEFSCEAGSVIAGYFESLEPGRGLRPEVFDPAYSKRRVAVRYGTFEKFRFSWAQPGVGPRCADMGEGPCPPSTPSLAELERRLAALREAP